MVLALALPAVAQTGPANPVDRFARHALAEWVVTSETLPAGPAALGKMLSDLPAAVRLAREVTGFNYTLVPLNSTEYELTTPRGLVARIRPIELKISAEEGLFESVGAGTFQRPTGTFRGKYALRFKYRKTSPGRSVGEFQVYIDVDNPILRFFGIFVRGMINERLAEEMRRMLGEAKAVMSAAETRLARGSAF